MNDLKQDSIRFLLGVVIPLKDDKRYDNKKLYSAIWRAHRDVLTARSRFTIYHIHKKEIHKQLYGAILQKASKEKLNSESLFEAWTCQEMCSHKTPKILDRQISGGVMRELL